MCVCVCVCVGGRVGGWGWSETEVDIGCNVTSAAQGHLRTIHVKGRWKEEKVKDRFG